MPPAGVAAVLHSATGTLVPSSPGDALLWLEVGAGTHWIRGLQDALGASDLALRSVHPVATVWPAGATGSAAWLAAWADVRHRRHRPVESSPRHAGDLAPVEQRIVALAEVDRLAGLTDERWYRDRAEYFAALYLADDDEFRQSGKAGDAADWELGRRVISRAVDRSGTVLDVGCANGLFLQSLRAWAGERGHELIPYGVDLVPELVALARERLPRWRDNFYQGNAANWTPPRRFDIVYTLLEYVPQGARPGYVDRLLHTFLVDDGRLVVGDYGHGADEPSAATSLCSWGFRLTGQATQRRDQDRPPIEACWLDRGEQG